MTNKIFFFFGIVFAFTSCSSKTNSKEHDSMVQTTLNFISMVKNSEHDDIKEMFYFKDDKDYYKNDSLYVDKLSYILNNGGYPKEDKIKVFERQESLKYYIVEVPIYVPKELNPLLSSKLELRFIMDFDKDKFAFFMLSSSYERTKLEPFSSQ